MGVTNVNTEGQIKLYTNHTSPWAHRVHIVLKELGVEYDEELVTLEVPKSASFLKLNPRGLVPTITYSHPSMGNNTPQPIIESDLIVRFLLESHPQLSQRMYPAPTTPEAAHVRYRMHHFVDTFFSQIHPVMIRGTLAVGTPELAGYLDAIVAAMKEHIEPLLADAAPFFAGSSGLTYAEIQTAPFILRLMELPHDGFVPTTVVDQLNTLPNFSRWAKATIAQRSVRCIWNTQIARRRARERLPKLKAKYAARLQTRA